MTTNSPNPVDGDVQALIRNIQRRIKNTKRWLSANKSIGNPESEAVELILIYETALAALTTPPAQLLRPVELPGGFSPAIGDIFDRQAPVMRRDATDGNWLHKAVVAELLLSLGHEVKS